MKKLIFIIVLIAFSLGCYDGSGFFNPSTFTFDFDYPVITESICHLQTDSTYIQLEIDRMDLGIHLAHGDYVLDQDNDGYTAIGACAGSADDCDDFNHRVNPGTVEQCGNIIDDDCDGRIDQGCLACDQPILIEPDSMAVLDNGCRNRTNPIKWTFKWKECPDAIVYYLFVIREGENIPLIDVKTEEAVYEFFRPGFYFLDNEIIGWQWKVRTRVQGFSTPWSDIRTFEIEPLDTDCP